MSGLRRAGHIRTKNPPILVHRNRHVVFLPVVIEFINGPRVTAAVSRVLMRDDGAVCRCVLEDVVQVVADVVGHVGVCAVGSVGVVSVDDMVVPLLGDAGGVSTGERPAVERGRRVGLLLSPSVECDQGIIIP